MTITQWDNKKLNLKPGRYRMYIDVEITGVGMYVDEIIPMVTYKDPRLNTLDRVVTPINSWNWEKLESE